MTNKKRRQRGSRTHGGGSQKNRRGAGHRGGRGKAGRDKHEHHNHPPLGEEGSGFTRPEKTQDTVVTVDVRELDEDAPLLAAEGLAEETDSGYEIDARDIVDGADTADRVKVLGAGQVRNELSVTADDFSDGAVEKIEAAGGETEALNPVDDDKSTDED
jgi:large subunit ribosomal protein L15